MIILRVQKTPNIRIELYEDIRDQQAKSAFKNNLDCCSLILPLIFFMSCHVLVSELNFFHSRVYI